MAPRWGTLSSPVNSSYRSKNSSDNFPPQFQTCVQKTDQYARSINLMPSIRHFPLPGCIIDQIGFRLERNRSFIKCLHNPNPPQYHSDEFRDAVSFAAHLEDVVASLNDKRQGLLIMLVQPPKNVDLRHATKKVKMEGIWRAICGVVVRIGPSGVDLIEDTREERAITAAFCVPNFPDSIAKELMRVTLARAIAEAFCFEEVAMNDSDYTAQTLSLETASGAWQSINKKGRPSKRMSKEFGSCSDEGNLTSTRFKNELNRDRRFISIEMSDLLVFPTVVADLIKSEEMKFSIHVDKKFVSRYEELKHEDKGQKSCRCIKRYHAEKVKRNSIRSVLLSPHSTDNTTNLSETIEKPSTSDGSVPTNGVASNVDIRCQENSLIDSGDQTGTDCDEKTEYYQYFTLNTTRAKGLLSRWVPRKVLPEVLQYFGSSFPVGEQRNRVEGELMSQSNGETRQLPASEYRMFPEALESTIVSDEDAGCNGRSHSERYRKNKVRRLCVYEKENTKCKYDFTHGSPQVVEFDRCSRSSIGDDSPNDDKHLFCYHEMCCDSDTNRRHLTSGDPAMCTEIHVGGPTCSSTSCTTLRKKRKHGE